MLISSDGISRHYTLSFAGINLSAKTHGQKLMQQNAKDRDIAL